MEIGDFSFRKELPQNFEDLKKAIVSYGRESISDELYKEIPMWLPFIEDCLDCKIFWLQKMKDYEDMEEEAEISVSAEKGSKMTRSTKDPDFHYEKDDEGVDDEDDEDYVEPPRKNRKKNAPSKSKSKQTNRSSSKTKTRQVSSSSSKKKTTSKSTSSSSSSKRTTSRASSSSSSSSKTTSKPSSSSSSSKRTSKKRKRE